MDEAGIERAGTKSLRDEMARIDHVRRVRDLSAVMAHLDLIGVTSPISSYVYPDARQASRYAFWIDEDGLGLPDRDYYLSQDAKLADVRTKYRAHIAAMLRLVGDAAAEKEADNILALETKFARLHWAAVDARDPQKTYNVVDPAGLRKMAPAIDWTAFIAGEGLPHPLPKTIVRESDYLHGVSALLATTPLPVWKEYLRFRLLSASAPYLPKAFVDEDFAFNQQTLQGTPSNAERWKRGCELVDRLLGEASGKLYVARYFPAESKARALAMVGTLIDTYAARIRGLNWMSPATKAEALAKLQSMQVKVGYPDHWRDYSGLRIASGDLLGNVFRAQAFENARKHAQLSGPVDRSEWEMTTPTVDAYYSPGTNEITFPAGILQPPLYDPAADNAYNYGSTGATIGHEISHAFDNRGSQYDSKGNLRNWWTPEDHQRYKAETDKLVREFDAFEPLPGLHVNGALTLPENVADMAGLAIAYKAYVASLHGHAPPVIDGLTGPQRFFIGYAQSYLGKRREGLLMAQLKNNPHAPEKYRVNGAVMNLDSFYQAFDVKPGDAMYIPPEKRVSLW
jgi:predicted metalloendopeptidase